MCCQLTAGEIIRELSVLWVVNPHIGNFKYASRHNLYAGAVKQGLQNLPRRGTWGAAREGEKGTGDGVGKLLCLIGSCE